MSIPYQARLERVERLFLAVMHPRVYVMRDGSQIVLSRQRSAKGFNNALNHIDSPEARIILAAVTDDNGGKMLQLLRAVINSIDTEAKT